MVKVATTSHHVIVAGVCSACQEATTLRLEPHEARDVVHLALAWGHGMPGIDGRLLGPRRRLS
jgi:hypothetical protein